MSRTRERLFDLFSCCPCGMFTPEQDQSLNEGKYKSSRATEGATVSSDEAHCLQATQYSNHTGQTDEEKEQFKNIFTSVTGDDGEADAYQLKEILNSCFKPDFQFDSFDLDVCRSMVALGDPDLSGQLGYFEARVLWAKLLEWKGAFKYFDRDGNGYFHGNEFKDLLETLNYKLNEKSVKSLTARYSDREGRVYFGDFVACMLKLTSMYELYKDKSNNNMDSASFSQDEFIQLTLYS